jgi:hypothetical protein
VIYYSFSAEFQLLFGKDLVYVKQRAKVIGIVITSCPCCGNPINFDRQGSKICAYCEELVHIDLDKVEVNLHGPVSEGRKMKISMN